MASDEGPKPKSLREIAARAKDAARSGGPASGSAQDLINLSAGRTSQPPTSSPPGGLAARPSQPPVSRPPGALPPPPSRPPGALGPLSQPPVSRPPGSLPPPPSRPPGSLSSGRASSPPVSTPPVAVPPSVGSPATPPTSTPPSTMRTPEVAQAKDAPINVTEVAAAKAPEARGAVTPVLLGVGLVAALGLGVVFTRKPEPTATPMAATTAKPTAAISAEPKPEPSPPAAATTAAPAADSGAVDINALAAPDASAAKVRVPGPMPKVSGDKQAETAPPPTTATAEPVASAAPRPLGSVGELHDEMRKRVGATDQPGGDQGPAAGGGDPNAKQEKPSNAAVLGALGSVRGAVKACIADTDKPTRISVTFQSDGSVRTVAVSGGAAGKPSEACVVAAVKKARVAPFMADSFSTSFSVSP